MLYEVITGASGALIMAISRRRLTIPLLKQAILTMKAEQNRIDLPRDVALFLANATCSNVRELEGLLIRLGAYSSLTSTPITLET